MESKIKAIVMAVLAVFALILFMSLNPLVIVHPGQRGVVIQLGAVQDQILGEGIHFVMPITQSVKKDGRSDTEGRSFVGGLVERPAAWSMPRSP